MFFLLHSVLQSNSVFDDDDDDDGEEICWEFSWKNLEERNARIKWY